MILEDTLIMYCRWQSLDNWQTAATEFDMWVGVTVDRATLNVSVWLYNFSPTPYMADARLRADLV